MSNTIETILAAKTAEGAGAYLWLHSSGDCILWSCEQDSIDDDGANAVGRWQLSKIEAEALAATGEVDEQA